ncbi:McrC family protein [Mobilicoccus pelagius]|uniref:Putative McrC protein n=1 Tax=Mobilicoccus pelagius NBRC 104925 TaxID=1089455 RepID=H5UMM1_9MICO|nr:putative McrC protein [Mobilicoccus pelagius]GAB46979.1 putative McrC protein [Mobilicoccus pelagius NBRC 104925]
MNSTRDERLRIELVENDPAAEVALTPRQAQHLGDSGVITATPTLRPGRWMVAPDRYVGIATLGDVEVSIRPKLPIRRLMFLLGYAYDLTAWRDDPVGAAADDDLLSAVATAFARQAQRAVEQGLLQGYRDTEEAAVVLRGRLRTDDQLRGHFGLPIPLEIRYDDYTVDIAENRILRTAAERLLRLPRLHATTRRTLLRLVRTLADTQPLPRGSGIPAWQPSRLNARYHPALRLGELVLRGGSFEHADGHTIVDGFLVDMARLFEQFLTVALREALAGRGGTVDGQNTLRLDTEGAITIRPDILWRKNGAVAAVVDAKYKAGKSNAYPNADVYQMLTYCTRLGLATGHLVYAKGESVPGRARILGTDLVLVRHALDLDTTPDALLSQIVDLAAAIAADAHLPSRRSPATGPNHHLRN